ncbi:MAG: DUF4166 domain-containing protein [Pseudomonadota bacterium]
MLSFHLGNHRNLDLIVINRRKLLQPLLSAMRSSLLWLRSTPEVLEADTGRHESTIKKQMGAEWSRLNPNVQERFATEPALTEQVFYRGIMETVECSLFGKIFAQLTRPVVNPLTPYKGKNVPLDVILYRKPGMPGVYWQRTYYHLGRAPYTVTSVKGQGSNGGLTESVGAGFGMELSVSAEEGSLVFRSTRYIWALGKFRVPLPHLLTPGETRVTHQDLGDGTFRFTISMDHLWLGRTFYQTGIFKEV